MYRPGDHFVICEICGLRKYRSECRKNQYGQIVCSRTCYDPPNPQETAVPRPEKTAVRDPRPEGEPRFLEYGEITAADL